VAAIAAFTATLVLTFVEPASSGDSSKRGWFPVASTNIPRAEAAAATVRGQIYLAGGFTIGGVTTNQVERYDPRRDRWRFVSPMPITLNHPAAVAHRGKLYVLGGYRQGVSNPGLPTQVLDATRAFLRYDPETDRWSRLPAMPVPRAAAAAAVVGHRLFVAGGRAELPSVLTSQGLLKRLDIYNFKTGRWRRGPDMHSAREHVAGAAARGRFYVLAGRRSPEATAVAEKYVPRDHRWKRLPDMRVAHAGFPAVSVDGRVIAFGSEEPGTREFRTAAPETEILLTRRKWFRLPSMRTPRGAVAGAAIGRRVFAITGIERPVTTLIGSFSTTVEALDLTRSGRAK
jgi:non-specific serine/threonine protein kinase